MTRFNSLASLLRRWEQRQSGQTMVEYSLLIALLSIALIGTMSAFGGGVDGLYGFILTVVETLGGGSSST
jgi:Flp pilus assembly pilin Flp